MKDAIALLKQDHANVKAMFKDFAGLGERAFASKKRLADKICLELTRHATAEEELFYPALRAASKAAEDLVDEATVEHATAKDLIAQIGEMDPHDELFDAKVTVLGEYIDHHVKEEEGELFPQAKQAGLDLQAMAREIEACKDSIDFVPPRPPQARGSQGRRLRA